MFRRAFALFACFLFAISLTGCFGQSKATGKFSNQDKPKSADGAK